MGIEAKDLHSDLDLLASSGVVFSAEHRACLQTSLTILREQNKFSRVYLWGKILGTTEDYYIAQGCQKNELKARQCFYSNDCMNWKMLTPVSTEAKQLTLMCQGRFTGDPANVFQVTKYRITNENTEDEKFEEVKFELLEERRLAATIWKIDRDTSIVPRGAYILKANRSIEKNRLFEGLSKSESTKLFNYLHFRPPIRLHLSKRSLMHLSKDFLDSIDRDVPKGWSLQMERGSELIHIRSLKWIGMTFYHIPETNRFGSIYFGTGEENKDLPFMI